LPSDPSSSLILVTRAGSTIPPDGPIPQPELLKQKKKLLELNNFKIKTKTQETQRYMFRTSIHGSKFLPVRKNKLPYICQTETRHQQIKRMQTKFEYSAGGTNNTSNIPHQMPLFIKQHK
jgi:hypothetical protein